MAKKEKDLKENKAFLKELKAELKKVTWPTPKKLINSTSAVITIVLVVALIVFVLDVCFENLNKFGVGGLKSIISSSSETEATTDETGDSESTEEGSLEDGIDLVSDGSQTTDGSTVAPADGETATSTTETEATTTEETTQEVTQ